MVDKNLTYLFPVVDRSGSIAKHKDTFQLGFDHFMADQRLLPGRCLVTLAQFDTEYEVVYALKDVREVPPLVIEPRGGTALLDAIGRTITTAGDQLASMTENSRPGAVVVPIVTDGEENSSKEFTLWEEVKSMIKRQTDVYGWLFLYLGANQDAIRVGATLGISRNHALSYDTANADKVFGALSHSTTVYRGATQRGLSYTEAAAQAAFTDEQRDEALASSGGTGRHSGKPGNKNASR